jgi:SAM-dependent methyltransferase
MKLASLEFLRCPYCGGALELATSMFCERLEDEINYGVLGCQCCIFAIVDGVAVLQLDDASKAARAHVEAGRPDLARRAMFNLDDESLAARFEAAASNDSSTYRDIVDALGPAFEGGYFLYRFSDPTYIVADAVVRSVAGAVLAGGGRAVDLCGGSGHLTRSLLELSPSPPVLADLYFSKIWLARRFTAPGCEGVCCDGNAPFPFARGAFRYAMCADAFMYIWTKRQFVGEMLRAVDDAGAVVIAHAHNELTWSPSHGQPLTPEGYRSLFETLEPRIFAEANLFADTIGGGPLDLSRRDSAAALDGDPALTMIASRNPQVFIAHALRAAGAARGEHRLNPLYAVEPLGDRSRLRLRFPSEDYEQEYGACRRYLPDEAVVSSSALAALGQGPLPPELADLARRRVILDLPKRYY